MGIRMACVHSPVTAREGLDGPVAVLSTAGYPACDPAFCNHTIVTDDVTGTGPMPEARNSADGRLDRSLKIQ
jgi:hypothetical protein